MISLFVAIQSFLSSKLDRAIRALIGEHVREMFALNVLQNILFCSVWLYSTAESTTDCPIKVLHKILVKILTASDLT